MSGSIRLFVTAPLHDGAVVVGSPAQAHYLGTVMRRGPGDALRLFNGVDGEWHAEIAELRRERLLFSVACLARPQVEEPDLWLAFAPLKRDATDMVVQKATELGVSAILPVLTAHTNAARVNAGRLAAIAAEAAEQSERVSVPRIGPPVSLAALLDSWPPDRPLVAALERTIAPPIRAVCGPAGLLIGPEGGFTTAELDALAGRAFVVPASLGSRIMRAETAVIAGLVLLQAGSDG